MTSRRVTAIAVTSALVAVVVFVGLATWFRPSPGPCPAAFRTAVTARATTEGTQSMLVLIAPFSNDALEASKVAAGVTTELMRGIEKREAIRVVYDPGQAPGGPAASGALRDDACLAGSFVYTIEGANPTRRQQDVENARLGLQAHIAAEIERHRVQYLGSPLRILQRASAPQVPTPSDLVLWADFLSNAPDCADPDGHQADPATIRAIVARCAATGTIHRTHATVRILGAGDSPRSVGFEQWARDLARAFCGLISDSCQLA